MSRRLGIVLLLTLLPAGAQASAENPFAARIDRFFQHPAAPVADDATFLRRVALDLTGTLPSPERTLQFLDDKSPDKRAKLVAELLAGTAYTEHWARLWVDTLTGQRPVSSRATYDGRALYDYLVDALDENRSFQAIARQLIVAEGVSQDAGEVEFVLRYNADPAELVGATSRVFLGLGLRCAQCHAHPFEKWSQDDFHGLAAFFGRVRFYQTVPEGTLGVVELRKGEYQIPDPSRPPGEDGVQPMLTITPRLPDGSKPGNAKSRRQQLAEWMTSNDNPYFARNTVNRVWHRLFGRGLVEPLDGLGQEPGPDAALLDGLAAEFVTAGHDLEKLLAGIVLSQAYQRSAEGRDETAYARFPVRPLSVDQVYHAVAAATGHRDDTRPEDQDPYIDPAVQEFKEDGQPVQRSLALLNGAYVEQAVARGVRQVKATVGRHVGPAHIERLYLATLCRKPTAEEAARMLKLMEAAGEKSRGLEDVLWVLLNSAEFNTNH